MTNHAPNDPSPKLGVTSLSQYVRLENCERFLRFRLRPDEERALLKKWKLTIQPLTPLLQDSGAEFEKDVAAKMATRGEEVIDLDGAPPETTLHWLREAKKPVILLQPELSHSLGDYPFRGRADVVRLHRDRQGRLNVLVIDIKASRQERMEHRLQVAIYARLLRQMAEAEGATVAEMEGAVLHLQEDGSIPALEADTPTFDLETYLTIVEQLVVNPDSVASRIAGLSFDEVHYHLSYKCDGCMYNAICMYDCAERLDLSLVPYLSNVEKRVLRQNGIDTVPQLAGLMQLPAQGSGSSELKVAPGQEATVQALANQWPVGQNLPLLVQRARRAWRRFDPSVSSASFLFGANFGTLPHDEEHPDLVKIFFDAQRDYLQDRVYLISGLVKGAGGERVVVRCADAPPTDESERELLVDWVGAVIRATRQVAGNDSVPIHLYCYNRYDQQVLLEALKRHLAEVAALPAFFDLMTQNPALTQPIISFLSGEIQERLNLGAACAPLHDAARQLGFDWRDEQHEYYRLFRARLFDNRRNVVRGEDGRLRPVTANTPADQPGRVTIEAASRFNSQIPLEYAYAAWQRLPEALEDDTTLKPFREVTLPQLEAFAGHRVRALAHIEGWFRYKARFIEKPAFNLPQLVQAASTTGTLAQSLVEFLYMEHHAAFQAKQLTYSLPLERRAQTGLALLLSYHGQSFPGNTYRFRIEFEALGLEPALAMNGLRLKEGAWVVFNSLEDQARASYIKNGRLATISAIGPDWIDLNLLSVSFRSGQFRYWHKSSLQPEPDQFYAVDEMADDMNGDKTLAALHNSGQNTLYHWLLERPPARTISPASRDAIATFAKLINDLEKPKRLTGSQREIIADRLAEPLLLVQGPPGTGKSYTLAWAVLARLAERAIQGQPLRVAVSSKTHNAVNIVLGAIAAQWQRLANSLPASLKALRQLNIYKLVNEGDDSLPPGVQPLNGYRAGAGALETILNQPLVVIGGTPGGLYNLARYRAKGGRDVAWEVKSFDLVVIDEASQISVPEGVLASAFLRPDGSIIVVGDHRQMPPIIAHNWEAEEKRSITSSQPYLSLFEFLRERDFPAVALDESFRLHTTVAEFLQDNVYVQDGIHFFSRRKELLPPAPQVDPYVDLALRSEYPIVVIEHGEQRSQQYNETELALVKPLVDVCVNQLWLEGRYGVGVVVPHRAQRAMLREAFPTLAEMDAIDTVERFQGGERDVIIVSATASDPDYVLAEADFLLNLNRLNVALSRPRKKLIVVASRSVVELLTSNLEVFQNAIIWKKLYYQYAGDLLWQGARNGVPVRVRGKKAAQNGMA